MRISDWSSDVCSSDLSDYYVLGLYRDISQAPKFMNRGQFDQVRRRWNPPAQGIFEFNKWIFGHYCASVGIPTPRCYGLFHPSCGITAEGRPLRDLAALGAWMSHAHGALAITTVAGTPRAPTTRSEPSHPPA